MSHHHHRIQGPRWRRLRRQVLEVANWRCTECNRYGNEVDHIVPLHRGGEPWALDNLQALCRACHIAKTARENRRVLTPEEAAWRALLRSL